MSEIVVGVDESAGAAQALRWAVREGELHGWSPTAVMAWGLFDQHHPGGRTEFDPNYGESNALAALDSVIAGAVGADAAPGVGRRVVCDLPARALLEAASGAELLVVGARGLGGFRGVLLGSVSQHCLHHATTPVAVVREGSALPGEGRRIVVAVDGSDTSKQALRWAITEATRRGVTLAVVNAWHQPFVGTPYPTVLFDPALFREASAAVLDEALTSCDPGDVIVERITGEGTPASVILDAAADADLVVMGSRGLGGFKGMLLGSVTTHVTRHASCPVIVVPPPS